MRHLFKFVLFVIPIAAVLAAFSGFPRYDVLQCAVSAILGALGLTLWRLLPPSAAPVSPWANYAGGAWLALLSWAIGRTALGGLTAESYDGLALLVGATPMVLAAAYPRDGVALAPLMRIAVAVSAIAVGVCSLLGLTGTIVPPPVPTNPLFPAPHPFFDDPHQAATWLAVALPLLVSSGLATDGVRRILFGTAAGFAAIALGLTDSIGVWWPVAAASIIGAIFSVFGGTEGGGARRLGAWVTPWMVAAALQAVPSPALNEPESDADGLPSFRTEIETGSDSNWTDADARHALSYAAYEMAKASQPLGAGPGTFGSRGAEYLNHDDPWVASHTTGLPSARRAPSAFLQQAAEFGFLLPLLLISVLGFAIKDGSRAPDKQDPAPPIIPALGAAVAAYAAGPGWLTAGSMTLMAVVVLVAMERPAKATQPASQARPLQGVLMLAVMVPLVVWPQIQTIRWGIAAGRGIVQAWYAHLSEARSSFNEANAIQPRFESLYNLGLLLKFNPDGGLRPAMAAFQSAVELRPGSAMARYALADCFSRIAPPNKEEAEQALGKTSALLERALDVDPNLYKASELLSDVYFIHQEPDRALETLRRVIERPIPEAEKFEAYVRIGRMYEESKEDPTRALEFYEKAIPLISNKEQAEYLKNRVATAEKWKKEGHRPEEGAAEEEHPHGPSHEVGGPDEHGHDEHGHEGHDHAGSGSGAP